MHFADTVLRIILTVTSDYFRKQHSRSLQRRQAVYCEVGTQFLSIHYLKFVFQSVNCRTAGFICYLNEFLLES
jgi:hypothetical protein